MEMNSLNNNSNINSPMSNSSINIINKKINFGESSLEQYINNSIYEEIKYQNEAKEILSELRAKYLPNSIKRNKYGMNSSQNMTYFNNNNKNNSNLHFSTYTDYNNYYPNTSNISTEKIDYYKTQKDNLKLFQNTFLDKRDSININESIKFDTLKNSNLNLDKSNTNTEKDKKNDNNNTEEKSFLNDYLTKENERLKRINKNYELFISSLIDYINDINYYFGENIINYHNINQIIKNGDLNNNSKSLDDIKSFLKSTKNNIFNSYKYKKNIFLPKDNLFNLKDQVNSDKINYKMKSFTFNEKDKAFNIGGYKPIIADKNNDNIEKNVFKSTEISSIKRAKTMKQRMPKSFWSQNKRVNFK